MMAVEIRKMSSLLKNVLSDLPDDEINTTLYSNQK